MKYFMICLVPIGVTPRVVFADAPLYCHVTVSYAITTTIVTKNIPQHGGCVIIIMNIDRISSIDCHCKSASGGRRGNLLLSIQLPGEIATLPPVARDDCEVVTQPIVLEVLGLTAI